METYLKHARVRRGLTLEQAAERASTSAPQIYRLEEGQRRLTWDWAARLAAAYDCDPIYLMYGRAAASVPVVGTIGEGAIVAPIVNKRELVDCPRGLNPGNTVALLVRGDALLPTIGDGWFVFYSKLHEDSPLDVLHQLCVVQLVDHRTLVRNIRRGPSAGHYNLESPQSRTIEDVEIEWCARVRAILPPDLVEQDDALAAAG